MKPVGARSGREVSQESDDIAKMTAAFLARGGKITVCEKGRGTPVPVEEPAVDKKQAFEAMRQSILERAKGGS